MAHKLDGKWHSYVVVKLPSGTETVIADDDFFIDVRVNETTGAIESGSHSGKPISGSIIPIGNSFAVTIEHERSTLFNSRYEGALVAEDGARGILIIAGTKRKVPKAARPKGEDLMKEDVASQEEGTWVGTKP